MLVYIRDSTLGSRNNNTTQLHLLTSESPMSQKKTFANVKNELLAEQKQEIREAFQLFDMNHDGMLDYHEFKVALRALGFDASKKEVLDIIHKFDTDDTNLISYDNFYLAGMLRDAHVLAANG